MENTVGIFAGFWTSAAAKAALIAVSHLSFRTAAQLHTAFVGHTPSKSSLHRLTRVFHHLYEPHLSEVEAEIRAEETIPAEVETALLSMDGVMVKLKEESQPARQAAARQANRDGTGPLGQRESLCASLTYYNADGDMVGIRRQGRMPGGWAEIESWLSAEREKLSWHPRVLVMAGGDGSRGLWKPLSRLNTDEELLDFYHASSYLKTALDGLLVGESVVSRDQQFSTLRHTLRHDAFGAVKVKEALVRLEVANPSDKWRRGSQLFSWHHSRMDYAGLSAQNLPIGTGSMEGTCKYLVTARMKGSGMRWSQEGGQAILTLRALVIGERFEPAWARRRELQRKAA